MDKLIVTSPVFKNGELMPKKYSQYGENVNPPLDISGIPAQTKTLCNHCNRFRHTLWINYYSLDNVEHSVRQPD